MRIRDAQKEQIRAALLRAGTELIEQHGLEATTIEAITSKAGVAKGTFYNYFKTKHDLVYSAVHESTEGWEDELDHILRTAPTTLERLLAVFRRIIAWVEKHPELNWIWMTERLQRMAASESERSPFSEIMKRIFAAGQAAGEIRTDRPPEAFAHDLSGDGGRRLPFARCHCRSGVRHPGGGKHSRAARNAPRRRSDHRRWRHGCGCAEGGVGRNGFATAY